MSGSKNGGTMQAQSNSPWYKAGKKKWWYMYMMEYYAAERKKELLPFTNGMDGTGEHYAEWNKAGGER